MGGKERDNDNDSDNHNTTTIITITPITIPTKFQACGVVVKGEGREGVMVINGAYSGGG